MGDATFGKGCHLHLIDGSSFIFRAYHALPPLTRKSDGLPVGAVSGFVNMLWKLVEGNGASDGPTHIAVVFDKGSHTFRNDLYDLYKANRDAMPEDLRPQIPLTRDATRAFNIACLEQEGFEADDIIATLACRAREAGGRVTIISSDKDLMQLVGGGVQILRPGMQGKADEIVDREGVEAYFGVPPERVVDVQALAGDSVDNVPGAPGIGIKTAALLIQEFGDLDSLLARAEEVPQPKRRQTLIDHAAQIRLSRRLVQLDCDMPFDVTLDALEVKDPDPDTLLAFLNAMEFRTVTRRVAEKLKVPVPAMPEPMSATPEPSEEPGLPPLPPIDTSGYEWIRDAAGLQRWIDKANARGWIAIDTETTSLDEMRADLVGICLCVEPGAAAYVPLQHRAAGTDDLFGSNDLAEGQMPLN
jgi:DNA polymerase I